MLKKLHIQGFQPHKDLTIDFDSHVTVLTGLNDVGKSAVVRALKWVISNKYDGKQEGLVNWDSKFAKVSLTLGKYKIVRKQGKGVNLYRLDKAKYVAFGAGKVPDPISDLLRVDEVNFQDQLAGPFWFGLSPGQVSKELNKIINLQAIDTSLGNIAVMVRRSKTEVDIAQERLKEARDKKKELTYVPDLTQRFAYLTQCYNNVILNRENQASIENLLQQASKYVSARDRASCATLAGKSVLLQANKLSQIRDKAKVLEQLIQYYETSQEEQCKLTQEIQSCKTRLKKLMGSRCPLCGTNLKGKKSA